MHRGAFSLWRKRTSPRPSPRASKCRAGLASDPGRVTWGKGCRQYVSGQQSDSLQTRPWQRGLALFRPWWSVPYHLKSHDFIRASRARPAFGASDRPRIWRFLRSLLHVLGVLWTAHPCGAARPAAVVIERVSAQSTASWARSWIERAWLALAHTYFAPARRRSSTRTLEIVLQRLLPSVVLWGRRRRQTRARWNAGVDALHCLRCLHPVIRHLEHHILVLLALCTGCPTQALCGKIAVFFGRKECRTHDIPCATISRTCHENEDNGPDARVPKSVIHLKVDAEIPDAHSRKPLAEQI